MATPSELFDGNEGQLFDLLSTHPAVLVHLDAPWNSPARENRLKVETLRDACCPDVHVVTMDIDVPKNGEFAANLGVLQIPFFAYYVDGEHLASEPGLGTGKAVLRRLQEAQASIPWYW